MKTPNAILTPEQVAEELSLGVETVRCLMRRKEIPSVKVGGSWRTTRRALYGYLEDKMGLPGGLRVERGEDKCKGVLQVQGRGKGMDKKRKGKPQREPEEIFFPR